MMESVTVPQAHTKPWLWRNRFQVTIGATALAFLLYVTAYGFGLVPAVLTHNPDTTPSNVSSSTQTQTSVDKLESKMQTPTDELPTQIHIPKINIKTTVKNPASKRTDVLNRYLAESAVRYPDSGKPANGNMFIFGHSSGLDSVINQAYKTFNRLEELSAGDTIFITGGLCMDNDWSGTDKR